MKDFQGSFVDPACPIDWSHPLNRGLVGEWAVTPNPGWRGGLTFRDLVRGGRKPNDGTLAGGPTWKGPDSRPGGYGSLSFDGTDDYVHVASGPNFPDIGGAKSIAFWTQHDGDTAGNRHIMFSLVKDDTSGAGNALEIEMKAESSVPRVRVTDWGGSNTRCSAYLNSPVSVPGNAWFHVLYTAGASWADQKLYVNGVDATSAGEVSASAQAGFPAVMRLASFNSAFPSPHHNRPMDGVRVYSRALTAAEARPLYEEQRRGSPDLWQWVSTRAYSLPQAGGGGGGGVSGSLSATLSGATLSSAGAVAVSGALSVTLAGATLSSAGAVAVAGSSSAALGDASLSAAGAVAVAGSLDATLAGCTLFASAGAAVTGGLSVTLDAATLSSAGAVAVAGSLSAALGDATLSSAGAVAVSGALSAALAGASLSGAGALPVSGALSATLAGASLSASGSALPAISGALSAALAGATLSAAVSAAVAPDYPPSVDAVAFGASFDAVEWTASADAVEFGAET